jgi:predicted amidohydrolase
MRYYRAKGCRLVVNPTAVNTNVTANNVKDSIEYLSANNAIYIASANLIGLTQGSKMIGGSSIIGPSINVPEVFYYGGTPFDAPKAAEEELHIATIDLSITEKPFLAKQWSDDEPDWRPEIYMEMYKEIANTEKYLNKKY